jgi:metal-responsive CopG/Arc/MetJ family transcriptional regulator
MRTTVSFDQDVLVEIARLRRDKGVGMSEAVNTLLRRGLVRAEEPTPYLHRSSDIGLVVDVSDVADVLDLLDGA